MGNVAGQAYALSVLTPVHPDRIEALRATLAGLPEGDGSPLARLGRTHFARWVILDELRYDPLPAPPPRRDPFSVPYLLFTSNLDGPLEPYLDLVCERIPEDADRIWGHCVGYPGTADRAAFAAYLRHNQFDTGFFVCAYPERTVGEVRSALDARERLATFAVAAQAMDPRALQAAFLAQFGTRERAAVP
jgi:hypothetical protein